MTVIDLLSNPVVQDPAYHLFADGRTLLAIPNFWNVVSNLPFLVVGAIGFQVALEKKQEPLRAAWLAFFAGVFLTAFGSGYYHLAPDNESLAWDRLTMTIGLMSFVAIVIGEY
ncbi:MAG: alkaline phytoceramidase, partial [Gammaproteobacteria bacterium]|nr:alkaline phytoceramidase [Gammaproteobacteria bacterium]